MSRALLYLSMLAIILTAAGWLFYYESFAVEKSARYRPLANGWVSYSAYGFMQDEPGFLESLVSTTTNDLKQHGRFRPVFFLYVSSPYVLSPILHKRSAEEEGRPYYGLVNGDLRLFSIILVSSVVVSLIFMSMLIYHYTKEVIFSFLPIFFIPLSPSLTENLLQNYIDSQEIPLVLWISCWAFFFFFSLITEKPLLKISSLVTSFGLLILTFLTKETAVILSVALTIVSFFSFVIKPRMHREMRVLITVTLAAILLSGAVYYLVSVNKQGYSANYSLLDVNVIVKALKELWEKISILSLNNIYGYIPILIFFIIAIIERHGTINGHPTKRHALLLLFLLLVSCGFFFILVPWRPILIKYLYPSIFFFTFAVAFSLSATSRWAKERFGRKGYLIYLFILPYIFLFDSLYAQATLSRDRWGADVANYGMAAADKLAESIDRHQRLDPSGDLAIFMEYGLAGQWGNYIPWAKLHLKRILNLDKEINLVDRHGKLILNYTMPKAELSSFKIYPGHRNLYLSNKQKEVNSYRFDAFYKGYRFGEEPLPEISVRSLNLCYHLSEERIDWKGRSGKVSAFSMYKYIPGKCQEIK